MEYNSSTPIDVFRFMTDESYQTIPMAAEMCRRKYSFIDYVKKSFYTDTRIAPYALLLYCDKGLSFPFDEFSDDFYIEWTKNEQRTITNSWFIRKKLTTNLLIELSRVYPRYLFGLTLLEVQFVFSQLWNDDLFEFIFFNNDRENILRVFFGYIPENYQTSEMWCRLIRKYHDIDLIRYIKIEIDEDMDRAFRRNKLIHARNY